MSKVRVIHFSVLLHNYCSQSQTKPEAIIELTRSKDVARTDTPLMSQIEAPNTSAALATAMAVQ